VPFPQAEPLGWEIQGDSTQNRNSLGLKRGTNSRGRATQLLFVMGATIAAWRSHPTEKNGDRRTSFRDLIFNPPELRSS
jgi:hypothetical protein